MPQQHLSLSLTLIRGGGLDGRDFPSVMPQQHLSLSLIRGGGLDGRDFPSLTPLVIILL